MYHQGTKSPGVYVFVPWWFGWSFFPNTHLQDTILELAEIGVVLLMFIAGMEIDLGEMRESGKVALLAVCSACRAHSTRAQRLMIRRAGGSPKIPDGQSAI